MLRRLTITLLTATLALSALATNALACPMCKETVANSAKGTDVGDGFGNDTAAPASGSGITGGFNSSIYLMLASFFGVLGLVGFKLHRAAQSSPASR